MSSTALRIRVPPTSPRRVISIPIARVPRPPAVVERRLRLRPIRPHSMRQAACLRPYKAERDPSNLHPQHNQQSVTTVQCRQQALLALLYSPTGRGPGRGPGQGVDCTRVFRRSDGVGDVEEWTEDHCLGPGPDSNGFSENSTQDQLVSRHKLAKWLCDLGNSGYGSTLKTCCPLTLVRISTNRLTMSSSTSPEKHSDSPEPAAQTAGAVAASIL